MSDDIHPTIGLDLRATQSLGVFATLVRECEITDDEVSAFRMRKTITESWRPGVSFRGSTDLMSRDGFRRAQLGALHAVLAHWSTGRNEPATVVMPTGTGKTETMLALLIEARLERLLVIVPTDALRVQIAERFESLGLLPSLGVMPDAALKPVVGRLTGGIKTVNDAEAILRSVQVLVSTPHALSHSAPDARLALLKGFDALFIDEAHHVKAATWASIRAEFNAKPVVQFTATPFREDGQHLQGRFVYVFPLKEAQADGVFSTIKYESVFDLVEPDHAVAFRAVRTLKEDLAQDLDHVLMARCATRPDADRVHAIYRGFAADLNPVILHSGMSDKQRKGALDDIRSRRSRIVVCVDMLGEGFDLPQLKVAALHNPRQSLAPMLQLVGRFARVANGTGDATVVASRNEKRLDRRLARLYVEDADWNQIIADLTQDAVEAEEEASEFESGFGSNDSVTATRAVAPKMSTVVYRTTCDDWMPEEISSLYGDESLVAPPVVNPAAGVAWFVARTRTPVPWLDGPGAEDIVHGLYVVHWDQSTGLLYINQSANDGVSLELAQAVCGSNVSLIKGDGVFRAMGDVVRPVPTNVGVLDIHSHARRFSMFVGIDVSEGVEASEEASKVQTNVFVVGFTEGERTSVGVSLKGRIWSYKVARSIFDWMSWCHAVGRQLLDESIDVTEIRRNFVRPVLLEAWPTAVPLSAEWSPPTLFDSPQSLHLRIGGQDYAFHDVGVEVSQTLTSDGDLEVQLRAGEHSARYAIRIDADNGMRALALGPEAEFSTSQRTYTGADFLDRNGLTVLFSGDQLVVPPGVLLKSNRDSTPMEMDSLIPRNWTGLDIRRESRGRSRDESTIQGRCLEWLLTEDWDLIVDDDGPGEAADLVAFRRTSEHEIDIQLVHCKYSARTRSGHRIADLYEVCGQAQKSASLRRNKVGLVQRLIRRERTRIDTGGPTGIERGTVDDLMNLLGEIEYLSTNFEIIIAQPGVSKAEVTSQQLEILGASRVYIRETSAGSLTVWLSD